jgi:hypothetical protein
MDDLPAPARHIGHCGSPSVAETPSIVKCPPDAETRGLDQLSLRATRASASTGPKAPGPCAATTVRLALE